MGGNGTGMGMEVKLKQMRLGQAEAQGRFEQYSYKGVTESDVGECQAVGRLYARVIGVN